MERGIEDLIILAERKNDVNAQLTLGAAFKNGLGVEKDLKEAFRFYKLAALQNNEYGLYNVGLMYINGEGTKRNVESGVVCLTKASILGNILAIQFTDSEQFKKLEIELKELKKKELEEEEKEEEEEEDPTIKTVTVKAYNIEYDVSEYDTDKDSIETDDFNQIDEDKVEEAVEKLRKSLPTELTLTLKLERGCDVEYEIGEAIEDETGYAALDFKYKKI